MKKNVVHIIYIIYKGKLCRTRQLKTIKKKRVPSSLMKTLSSYGYLV